MKKPKLVLFVCGKCEQELCEAPAGAQVACPKCSRWGQTVLEKTEEKKR